MKLNLQVRALKQQAKCLHLVSKQTKKIIGNTD